MSPLRVCRLQPSHLHLVPPLVTFVANSPDVDKTTFSSVNVIYCAAAPLGKQLQKRFCEKTGGNFDFIEGMLPSRVLTAMAA